MLNTSAVNSYDYQSKEKSIICANSIFSNLHVVKRFLLHAKIQKNKIMSWAVLLCP